MKKKEPPDMKYVDILYHKNTPEGVSTKCNFDYHNENYAFFWGKKIKHDNLYKIIIINIACYISICYLKIYIFILLYFSDNKLQHFGGWE
jgi:hypothetical protein